MPSISVRVAPLSRCGPLLVLAAFALAPSPVGAWLHAPHSRAFQDGPPLDVFGIAAAGDQTGSALADGFDTGRSALWSGVTP